MTTTSFAFSGNEQDFIVPFGVTSMTCELWGGNAGGGNVVVDAQDTAQPYVLGGHLKASMPCTPGETLAVFVGGIGSPQSKAQGTPVPGGYNGGGAVIPGDGTNYSAIAGGGATDIRRNGNALANRVLVAGGAGGFPGYPGWFNLLYTAGYANLGSQTATRPYWDTDGSVLAGVGGGSTGGAGSTRNGNGSGSGTPATGGAGGGGTQTAGGAAGSGSGSPAGNPGTLGSGGAAAGTVGVAGGGGGGYYGGGGGTGLFKNNTAVGDTEGLLSGTGGGGGGSNYAYSGATVAINEQGCNGATLGWGWVTGGAGKAQDGTTRTDKTSGNGYATLTYNLPPNAPALSTPFNNAKVDSTQPITFTWSNSTLPEAGDTVSGFAFQWRVQGTTAWTTTAKQTSTATIYTMAVGTVPANQVIEWQVCTYGTLNPNAGPWSVSYFFTAVTPPAAPSTSAPTANQVITSSPITAVWTPDPNNTQVAFDVRRVADDGSGNPVPGTVYWDSGAVTSPATNYSVPFTAASRTEHVQVRTQSNNLWSAWTDIKVTVTIVPPNAPTISATPNNANASITVTVTNPTGGSAPPVDHNDIYRSSPVDAEIRVATAVPANGSWTDYTPGDSVPYSYRAVAVATNGAGISS